jgi:initiation factor 1A
MSKSNKNIKFRPEKASRILLTKNGDQHYGLVTKMLGNSRVLVKLIDDREVVSHIPGRFKKGSKKKKIIFMGDIVLIEFRSFEDRTDIVHVYEKDEVSKLIKNNEIYDDFIVLDNIETENKSNVFFDYDNKDIVPAEKVKLDDVYFDTI